MRHTASSRLFLLGESGVLAGLLLAWALLSHDRLTAADWAGFVLAATPLAIAAMVQTVPILAGGQGLAAGATALLVDSVVSGAPIDGIGSALSWIAIGLAIGGLVGLCNGLLIGFLRVPSTAVTYATGAGVGALAIVLGVNSGDLAPPTAVRILGSLLIAPSLLGLPVVPIVLLAAMAAAGVALRRSRFGRALRVTGLRLGLAERKLPAARLRCLAYVIAGLGYAVAGIVLAAQVGWNDAIMGIPILLQVFAAAALGGSSPGLRGGGTVGALLGAAIVAATANLFVPLDIPDILSPAFDAGWMLIGLAACRHFAGRAPPSPHPVAAGAPNRGLTIAAVSVALLIGLTILRPEAGTVTVVALGIGLLAVGQGAVMRQGGFDLSMPAAVVASGIATVAISDGSLSRFGLAVLLIIVGAVLLGSWHAMLAPRLGRGMVLATLASAGVLQAVATALLFWSPTGFVPLDITALTTRPWLRIPISVLWLLPLGLVAAASLDRLWRCGGRDTRTAYIASALSAALFGILLACVGGGFRLGIVDNSLIPAVAGAVIGGVRFARGDGSLLAAFGAALLVQIADTLLVALDLSYEMRLMAMAAAMLAAATLPAVTAPRLRSSGRA